MGSLFKVLAFHRRITEPAAWAFDMFEVLTAPNLEDFRSRDAARFFTRAWGNCGISDKFDCSKSLPQSRCRAASWRPAREISEPLSNPLHRCRDGDGNLAPAEERPHADAMVTKVKGIALGIFTADCGPLLFADSGCRVIGAAHAGWRGA